MQIKFSSNQRLENLKAMAQTPLDILVIGGGITGCGIALDAASRNLRVGLVEKLDYAFGTSSRSTKLIHGGLRYLKNYDFRLVMETARERTLLKENAPHLIHPTKVLLPIVRGGQYGRWSSSLGIWLYDRMARVSKSECRRMLSQSLTLEAEPLLRLDNLLGSALFYEYLSDDARLTISVAKTAVLHGALLCNYASVDSWLYKEDARKNQKIVGAKIVDQISGQSFDIQARAVVNATGPWVDEMRLKDLEQSLANQKTINGKKLRLTKGVHIVFDHAQLPVRQIVYFETDDRRMVFVIPRGNCTYVGTTDTDYSGDINRPQVLAEDIEYLLRNINLQFPTVRLTPTDVKSSWAGLRPLIQEEGKSPSEVSRKDEIFVSRTGLISIAGGKLTGYRKMAEKVVNLCTEVPSKTAKIILMGGKFSDTVEHYIARLFKSFQIPEHLISDLVARYGTEAEKILERVKLLSNQVESYDIDKRKVDVNHAKAYQLLEAEIRYTLENEQVVKAEDFTLRRRPIQLFEVHRLQEYQRIVERVLSESL